MGLLAKIRFITLVEEELRKHPDWMSDTVAAIQRGMLTRFEEEIEAKSNIAFLATILVTNAPKVLQKEKHKVQPGLRDLKRFFRTAPIEDDIEKFIISGE